MGALRRQRECKRYVYITKEIKMGAADFDLCGQKFSMCGIPWEKGSTELTAWVLISSISRDLKPGRKGLQEGFSQSSKRNTSVKIDQDKQERICTLMLLRQHVAHFTTTLQDYVESQLLYDVSSRFMHAIYDEAKDLQDLEAIHGAYLRDALHRCFLSDEMGPVKACIDEIMQCLLNLRSCLFYFGEQGEDGQFDITSDRVYSVVLEVKTQYEKSIKQLHHLRSASHNQTSLSYFWMRLDFNGFLADSCSRSS